MNAPPRRYAPPASLYYDSSVIVKLFVREDLSDVVTQFVARQGQAVLVNSLHEIEIRNALRLKRFRNEIDDGQPIASLGMIATDIADRKLIRYEVNWRLVHGEAERLSASLAARVGLRTIDLLHLAAALNQTASGLVSLDRRQCAAAIQSGLEVIKLAG